MVEVIELTNPTNLPDPSEIAYMEEPIVSAEIIDLQQNLSVPLWNFASNEEHILAWNM